jgi:hypothetical protein
MDRNEPKLQDAMRTLLPFLEPTKGGQALLSVESAPVEHLRRFYLFRADTTVLPTHIEDIQRFIEQRYLSLLSAAHRAGWTVLTAAVGSASGVELYVGFMAPTKAATSGPYVFERMLRGVLPGLELRFDETVTVESFLTGKTHGALIAGIPTLKIDDERQHFSLPAVLRGMHGEEYALVMVSRPLSDAEVGGQLRAAWEMRDVCHGLARRTRNVEVGGGNNRQDNDVVATTVSESRIWRGLTGAGVGGGVGLMVAGLPGLAVGAGIGASIILSASGQRSTTTTAASKGVEDHWSRSLSSEELNSVAAELETVAARHTDRLLKAANVGGWETVISFATATAPGRDILAGLLLGELAKPSTDVFPPRAYYGELNADRPLLLPGEDRMSGVFPRSLASYMTSEELASISAPPSENLPGYEIRRTPALSLTDVRARTGGWLLGNVCDHGRPLDGVEVRLQPRDLAKHLFVCGLTGTGKTTTVKEILKNADVPFLILESAKRDYRQLLAVDSLRDRLRIFTPGDPSIAPLQLNPFYVLPGVAPGVHIDYLKAIFNASFSLYGPMPYIVERCLHNIYTKRGWDLAHGVHPRLHDASGAADPDRYTDQESLQCFPTFLDLRDEVEDYVRTRLEYRGELSDNIRTAIITRLESLMVGAKGLMFNTSIPLDVAQLLAHPTVLELEALSDDDDKAFFVGLVLALISEHRQTTNPALNPYAETGGELTHILVIEEAHRLLKNVAQERQSEHIGNPRGKAIEFFANVIAEMRSMGQGVVVVEQIPSKLLPDVIKNTNAKIVHRLVSRDDQALLASTLGLEDGEAIYLTSLRTGHALYAREGMQRPIEVDVSRSITHARISHDRVKRAMHSRVSFDGDDVAAAMTVRSVLGAEGHVLGLQLLCTMACCEADDGPAYASLAVAAAKSRLLERNQRSSDAAIRRFLTDNLIGLLAAGVFEMSAVALRGMAQVLRRLFADEPGSGAVMQRRLSEGWGSADSRAGAVVRLRELVADRVLRAGVAVHDNDGIGRIVAGYFVTDLPAVSREIALSVAHKLGESTWSR